MACGEGEDFALNVFGRHEQQRPFAVMVSSAPIGDDHKGRTSLLDGKQSACAR